MDIIQKFSSFYTNLTSMKVDELSELYESNVIFIDPMGRHQGIEVVRQYFTRLLKNAKSCEFTISSTMQPDENTAIVIWTMRYKTKKLNNGNIVTVDGITHLKIESGKIILHRDYFDLGQMVYEHVPILGYFVKSIKRKMA